jgi:hypothetical protein
MNMYYMYIVYECVIVVGIINNIFIDVIVVFVVAGALTTSSLHGYSNC